MATWPWVPCHSVAFESTDRYVMRGLWFGPRKPKQVIIWIHGLSSSAFGMDALVPLLAKNGTAVLSFNNRGSYVINRIATTRKSGTRLMAGAAHETFTDCVFDIQGAIDFVNKQGVRNIYLAGHSTGCQKAMYWAYKKKSRGVKGIILAAPVSDYAAGRKDDTERCLPKAVKIAERLVRQGKPHALMPQECLTHWSVDDAQRFLSLYTPDSVEEIFSYSQPKKLPRILRSVTAPVLVLWAGEDQYADRPAAEIADWFDRNLRCRHDVVIVPQTMHSFPGQEQFVARQIKAFIKA